MSGLRQRLEALRSGSRQSDTAPGDAGASLKHRLDRLRARRAGHQKPADPHALAAAMGGHWLDEGVALIETHVPLTQRHGERPLADLAALGPIRDEPWGEPPERFLFLDTETTGLAGGTGTLVFLCGLARLRGDRLEIRQYLLAGPAAEPRFLDALIRDLSGEETLVSYNGLGFDRPLLAARFRLNGRPDATDVREHLDLLSYVRRAFCVRWPDCRLATAERRLLGFSRDGDISGAEAPESWLAYVRQGDGSRLPAVVRHNLWDLLSLAALLPRLWEVYQHPEKAGASVAAVARFLADRGDVEGAYALLTDNEALLDEPGQLLLARIVRRRGDLSSAVRIWTRLAVQGNALALEALAKYHEHVLRDCRAAAVWAARLPPDERSRRRLERLQGKLARIQVLATNTRPVATKRKLLAGRRSGARADPSADEIDQHG